MRVELAPEDGFSLLAARTSLPWTSAHTFPDVSGTQSAALAGGGLVDFIKEILDESYNNHFGDPANVGDLFR